MKKNHRVLHNFLLFSVFIFYIIILLALLFMNRHSYRSVNIVPFSTIIRYLSGDDIVLSNFALSNVLGNIVLFIPLGVYLTLFNRDKRLYRNIIYIALISLTAEGIQYIFQIGASDIDDVILNVFGGFLGVAAYRTLLLALKDVHKVRRAIEIIAPVAGVVCFSILFLYNA